MCWGLQSNLRDVIHFALLKARSCWESLWARSLPATPARPRQPADRRSKSNCATSDFQTLNSVISFTVHCLLQKHPTVQAHLFNSRLYSIEIESGVSQTIRNKHMLFRISKLRSRGSKTHLFLQPVQKCHRLRPKRVVCEREHIWVLESE